MKHGEVCRHRLHEPRGERQPGRVQASSEEVLQVPRGPGACEGTNRSRHLLLVPPVSVGVARELPG